ncbi:MAG: hypothetical protein ACEQSK_15080, partial [Sphingomonadaceae bacterium]
CTLAKINRDTNPVVRTAHSEYPKLCCEGIETSGLGKFLLIAKVRDGAKADESIKLRMIFIIKV